MVVSGACRDAFLHDQMTLHQNVGYIFQEYQEKSEGGKKSEEFANRIYMKKEHQKPKRRSREPSAYNMHECYKHICQKLALVLLKLTFGHAMLIKRQEEEAAVVVNCPRRFRPTRKR